MIDAMGKKEILVVGGANTYASYTTSGTDFINNFFFFFFFIFGNILDRF